MDMLSSLFCLFHVLTPIFIEKISPNPGLRLVLQCAAAAARPAVRAHRALRRGAR